MFCGGAPKHDARSRPPRPRSAPHDARGIKLRLRRSKNGGEFRPLSRAGRPTFGLGARFSNNLPWGSAAELAVPPPRLHLIINIDTILMALKYQDLEDLPTAFEKFMASSKGAADGSFAEKDFEAGSTSGGSALLAL